MKAEWFNDEDFWTVYAPVMFDTAHWAEVPAVADGITRLSGLDLYRIKKADRPAGQAEAPRCLDLCCGFGRIGLELARRGFTVTGVDITGPYLQTARKEAAAACLPAEFILEDVRSFVRPGVYDIAINMYNSFGYFENPADDGLFVRNALESLKPGGVFFIEVLGKEIVIRDFIRSEWFRRAGYLVFTEYEVLDSWGSIKNIWRLIPESPVPEPPAGRAAAGEGARIIEKTFVQRLYAASELRALLLQAGFASVNIYGDWDERAYDELAVKLIIAGRK